MITLEQARVGREDKVDQQVIDCFRQTSPLLDKMIFDDVIVPNGNGSTLKYTYLRVNTPSTADFREINKEYEPQEQTTEEQSVEIKAFGGAYEIDRVIEGSSGKVSEVARQTRAKIKAACNLFNATVINGDSAKDKKSFDGLDKALKGTKTEINTDGFLDVSSSDLMDKNYKYLMDLLDEFLGSLSGRPDFIMANSAMITKLKSAARRAGYLTHTEDAFGKGVDAYNGIPFMDMGYYAKKNDSGIYTEQPCIPIQSRTVDDKEVTGLSDIYAAVIDLESFHGLTVKGKNFVSQYLPDFNTPGAVKKGEVEMLAAIALKNSRGAAVLRNIKIK